MAKEKAAADAATKTNAEQAVTPAKATVSPSTAQTDETKKLEASSTVAAEVEYRVEAVKQADGTARIGAMICTPGTRGKLPKSKAFALQEIGQVKVITVV